MILLASRKLKLAYKEVMYMFHCCVHVWKIYVNVGVTHETLKDHNIIDGIIAL
jgi:hypothetical protein